MGTGKRKFRGHKKYKLPKKLLIPVKQETIKEKETQFDQEFSISENERIRYTYVRNSKDKITNIVCVSYDIQISEEWITIIYYDSEHGPLHRHATFSFENRNYDLPTVDQVKKKGTPEHWLTWAINDIKNRRVYYKKLFLRRSNIRIDKI